MQRYNFFVEDKHWRPLQKAFWRIVSFETVEKCPVLDKFLHIYLVCV